MESKIELTERLRREGRWAEASKLKDTALADFRAKGMKRSDAAEAAWAAMAEAYPPLPVAEGRAEPAAGTPEAMTTDAPPIPWWDLPTEGDFDEEVRWVHQQYILIIDESPRGCVIHWERATKKPPSTGACSLARWAADNRTAFYKDLLPKTMAKANVNQEEEAAIREERLKIEEVRGILGQMNKQIAEDLAKDLHTDVPAAVQKRVHEVVSTWSQSTWDHAPVSIPDDARASLEAHICGLVRDCIAAVGPSSVGK